jgi:hypothetical protein
MKKAADINGLFYYLVALPATVWIWLQIPRISALQQTVQGKPLSRWLALPVGLLLAEGIRRLLCHLGHKRALSNSLPKERRTYPIGRQIGGMAVLSGVLFLVALLLLCSPLQGLLRALQGLGVTFLGWWGIPAETVWPQWLGAFLLIFAGVVSLASPVLSANPPKYKTYSLEMFNPFLSRIALFSPERFTLRYLRKLIRSDFLNRFNAYTVFAGRIHCLYEGRETTWYVTYDERLMQEESKQRMLTTEHVQHYLDALRALEKADATLSHSIIGEVATEHGLAERAAKAGSGGDPELGDLTADEVERITRALAASGHDNVLTLDIKNAENDARAQQAYEKRLQEVTDQANRGVQGSGGAFELSIHRRDRKLTTKVLQFSVSPAETIRRSLDEYADKTGPQHSLLYATVRGASGEHAEGFDEETETVSEELEDLETVAGGASALDHIQELNPSVQQIVVQGKGFGRTYDIQLGKESYQVITEWLKSGGANPVNGWRLFRCSKVIDGDGKVVARRVQGWRDFMPHLLGTIGLGKEWSHVKITSSTLHNQDKLPLALLALDTFESNDFCNRRRILQAAPGAKK